MCLPMTVQRSFADRSHMRRRRINVSTYDGERSFADRRGRCGGADKSASKKAMTEYTTVALFFFFCGRRRRNWVSKPLWPQRHAQTSNFLWVDL